MDEIEVIETIENGERVFYSKPHNEKYQFYPIRKIPSKLFHRYVMERSKYHHTRGIIKRYFRMPKDKPMWVAKNHINEGEVHHFEDDGSVTISKTGLS